MAKLDPAPQKSENVISAEQHSDLIKLPGDETAYGGSSTRLPFTPPAACDHYEIEGFQAEDFVQFHTL
jgi:hypothetical protein